VLRKSHHTLSTLLPAATGEITQKSTRTSDNKGVLNLHFLVQKRKIGHGKIAAALLTRSDTNSALPSKPFVSIRVHSWLDAHPAIV